MADKNQDNVELIKRYREGDEKARDLLVKRNIKLVFLVVNKVFPPKHFAHEEAVSVGAIGLIKAINTFDVNAGVKFTTYASTCIRNEVFMLNRNINVKKNKLQLSALSMDYTFDEDDKTDLHDITPDVSAENAEAKSVLNSQIETIKKLIPIVLTESEQQMMLLIMQGKQQGEIGKQLHYSQPCISRMFGRARQKLKDGYAELERIDNERAKMCELTGQKFFEKSSLEIFKERYEKYHVQRGREKSKQ